MLKEAPNNNDSARVANNYALNEAPNRNNATDVANNVRLTKAILNGDCVSRHHTEKPTYQR